MGLLVRCSRLGTLPRHGIRSGSDAGGCKKVYLLALLRVLCFRKPRFVAFIIPKKPNSVGAPYACWHCPLGRVRRIKGPVYDLDHSPCVVKPDRVGWFTTAGHCRTCDLASPPSLPCRGRVGAWPKSWANFSVRRAADRKEPRLCSILAARDGIYGQDARGCSR